MREQTTRCSNCTSVEFELIPPNTKWISVNVDLKADAGRRNLSIAIVAVG